MDMLRVLLVLVPIACCFFFCGVIILWFWFYHNCDVLGKSTLLLAILGEITPLTGSIKKSGKVGYASQETWIISETVRENILFGQPFDEVGHEYQ